MAVLFEPGGIVDKGIDQARGIVRITLFKVIGQADFGADFFDDFMLGLEIAWAECAHRDIFKFLAFKLINLIGQGRHGRINRLVSPKKRVFQAILFGNPIKYTLADSLLFFRPRFELVADFFHAELQLMSSLSNACA